MNRLNSRHHLLFPAAEWSLRPPAVFLRGSRSLIPHLSRGDHDFMHRVVPLVPLLGHRTLEAAASLWRPEHDTMRDIDGLCIAIGRAAAHEKSHQLESHLAELAIESLQMQKSVLKQVEFQ